jgi:lipopolysaccharide/colanic/teichoic acid biosynthesis glycosyltransferase
MTAKRCFEVAFSLAAMVVLLPLILVIALLVLLLSGRPVVYRAERVGRGGRTFPLLKFRTMTAGAGGSAVTARADPRITPLGRVLRRSKLDELPQLFNVLRGDMSLVGPRPEDPRFVALYSPAQREVLSVRPGITSPAALRYRHEESLLAASGDACDARYVEEFMRPKLALDLDYVRRRSLWLDLWILCQTAVAVLAIRPPKPPHNGAIR